MARNWLHWGFTNSFTNENGVIRFWNSTVRLPRTNNDYSSHFIIIYYAIWLAIGNCLLRPSFPSPQQQKMIPPRIRDTFASRCICKLMPIFNTLSSLTCSATWYVTTSSRKWPYIKYHDNSIVVWRLNSLQLLPERLSQPQPQSRIWSPSNKAACDPTNSNISILPTRSHGNELCDVQSGLQPSGSW